MAKCAKDFEKAQEKGEPEKIANTALERAGVDDLKRVVSARHIRLSNVVGDSSPHKL